MLSLKWYAKRHRLCCVSLTQSWLWNQCQRLFCGAIWNFHFEKRLGIAHNMRRSEWTAEIKCRFSSDIRKGGSVGYFSWMWFNFSHLKSRNISAYCICRVQLNVISGSRKPQKSQESTNRFQPLCYSPPRKNHIIVQEIMMLLFGILKHPDLMNDLGRLLVLSPRRPSLPREIPAAFVYLGWLKTLSF